ncbi:ABC-type phosphate/phosphonate transport system, substrate-binding protein [Cohnella sp. OV330]|uniref:phosphate/phosphite/phosphonate ABC transporter substrate-binding protein n=1 Tax=Cohnella sp. OV330 TaxID=1855288 RepID=UPI0008F0D7EC|nr:PhnD/SsuA/transferrin family substrate-binding protein [Cohnella sp. OV330]SFA89663.1 ABC-type phosphate/phosphonate transport system, substrate-binding protein [Cohnella sp. OV330]
MSKDPIKVGAVIYDPRVTVIWGIIADFFKAEGLEIECVYYKDYEGQVDGLMEREIDIAWNSPLAWLDTYLRTDGKCLMGSMRDTDRDRKTVFVVRKDSGIDDLDGLRGKKIGFGAIDSPQARLIPINHLHRHGLEYGADYTEQRFDIGVGLHGDHVGGELDAMKALMAGTVDAAVALDLNWEAWKADGTVDANQLVCIDATSLFDHCIFTAHPDFSTESFAQWQQVLHRMDYGNEAHRKMMDMEGLKEWVQGRISGFEQLREANEYLKFLNT